MKKKLLSLGIILFFCFLVLLPLFKPGFFVSDDGDWMIIRLSAFYQSFREGQFPVRFLGRLNQSYGYPVSNFLYPGFLYSGSLLRVVGIPFITDIKIILIGSVVSLGIGIYFWLQEFSTSWTNVIASISAVSSSYLLYDLYKRGSVGEVLAMGVFPWILALWEKKKWLATTILIGFLIISHNSLAFVLLIFFGFYCLIRGKPLSVLPIIGGIGLSTFFWLPAVVERQFVRFDQTTVAKSTEYFVSNIGWSLLGWLFIGAVLFSFVLSKRTKTHSFFLITACSILFLVTPVSSLFWKNGILPALIQFPYRFLSLFLFVGTYFVASLFESLLPVHKYIISFIIVAVSLVTISKTIATVTPTNKPESFYVTNEATTTVANEYMPIWVKEPATERASGRIELFSGKGSFTMKKSTTQIVDGVLVANEKSVVQLNSIFYPGWGVTVDGIPVKMSFDNPRGVIRFPVAEGAHRIQAEFHETVPRFIADCISLLTLILLFFISMPFIQNYFPQLVKSLFRNADQKKTSRKVRKYA